MVLLHFSGEVWYGIAGFNVTLDNDTVLVILEIMFPATPMATSRTANLVQVWCTTFILVRLHNIWVTVSPRSLHLGTGTDSDRVTRLTTYCREHAPSLANVVSTTPVLPPGTLCHLTYMTLLTLTHSRNDLKLFCLIVHTDIMLLYGVPGRFVDWRLTNLSLYCIALQKASS